MTRFLASYYTNRNRIGYHKSSNWLYNIGPLLHLWSPMHAQLRSGRCRSCR